MSKTVAEIQIGERDKGRLEQAAWASLWHSCARFCCPEKAQSMRTLAQTVTGPGYRPEPQRHNDAAVDGLRVFSGGMKTWACPGPGSGWWMWIPHPALSDSTDVKDWLADCVERADNAMDAGGFYSGAHSVFEDLGLIATAGFFTDSTGDMPLTCSALSASEFVFTVDFQGRPNGVWVTYFKSADSLIAEFGKENVPERVRQEAATNKGETMHEIIHAVVERPENERSKAEDYGGNPLRMPFVSYWIHVTDKRVMREGGYDEMPFAIPRWRVPTGSKRLYGVSPAMDALASARGVNLMDMLQATQVEVQLNPRILAPPGIGAIDLSPGGVTARPVGGEAPAAWLHEASRSGIQAADGFISRKEAQVLRAFHADLFEKLAPIAKQRQMTNGLVEALERESLSRISPAMGRIGQEFIDPVMRRIFMILFRAGLFAPPPDEAYYTDSVGRRYLVFPRVAQTSRMAQALNGRKAWAYRNAMDRIAPLAPFKPEVLDIYNFDNIHRDLDRNDGMPEDWHRSEEDVEALHQARIQAQQKAQAQRLVADMATKQPEALAQAAGMMGGEAA